MQAVLVALAFLSIASGALCLHTRCNGLTPRIPDAIHPETYNLLLHPRLQEGAFTGSVNITFNLTAPLLCIPVHVNGLIVTHTELTGPQGPVSLASLFGISEMNYWVAEANQDLVPGNYNISLKFAGSALNKMTGFYRSSYRFPGETRDRFLMTTKFEPTDARQAFPCFDEPRLKARFRISVVRPEGKGFVALSNSKVSREILGPSAGEKTVKFEETPAMSTYLVAAIVSDFQDLGPVMIKSGKGELPLRVFAVPHLVNNTAFARRVGKEVLEFFSNYFGVPFPLPKMDMIAIPDFISGAMENWGLITYRESRLVVSEDVRSFDTLRHIAHVVAHELSHQWFGNLVTMEWWNDLWLNEGFARFMEYKGVSALSNESALISGTRLEASPDLLDLKMSVMVKDGLLNSHPIVTKVNHPEEISEIFDVISYSKGASILMMMEQTLGEDIFKKGVQNYLKDHSYGNAASTDLWTALSKAANISLVDSMSTWTDQMGYPMLNVQRTGRNFKITQQRFLNDVDLQYSPESSPFRYTWDIPICILSSNSQSKTMWLNRRLKKLVVPEETWIKLNCRGSGYYRVNYDLVSWATLTELLLSNYTVLEPSDRANLLDDAFALANSGYIDFAVPLRLVSYLSNERSRQPLVTGFSHLLSLKTRLSDPASPLTVLIRELVKKVYDDMLSSYTWDFTKQQLNREEQRYILQVACKSAIRVCRQAVSTAFEKWVQNETFIHSDLRGLVYGLGMKYAGTVQDWEVVLNRYRKEFDPQERELLMTALVSTKEEDLMHRLLNDALSGGLVREQDFFTVLTRVGIAMPNLAWDWYRQNYNQLVARFTLSHKGLGRSLESITSRFRSQKKIEQLEEFIRQNPVGGASTMTRKKALEKIRSNLNWLRRAKLSITAFFEKRERQNSLKSTHTRLNSHHTGKKLRKG